MSKSSPHDLELQIQASLLARIRDAAHTYRSAPSEEDGLRCYVAALECLAEYVATKCQEMRPPQEIPLAARIRRHPLAEAVRSRPDNRVIPFPCPAGAPFPAA